MMLGADPERSVVETLIGANPGQIARDLKTIKMLLIVGPAVTVGLTLVLLTRR